MKKYVKYFEEFNPPSDNDPKIGDYIVMEEKPNDIGRIFMDVSSDLASFRTYKVKFGGDLSNVNSDDDLLGVWDSEILFFSSKIEDVKAYIKSNKYNL